MCFHYYFLYGRKFEDSFGISVGKYYYGRRWNELWIGIRTLVGNKTGYKGWIEKKKTGENFNATYFSGGLGSVSSILCFPYFELLQSIGTQ